MRWCGKDPSGSSAQDQELGAARLPARHPVDPSQDISRALLRNPGSQMDQGGTAVRDDAVGQLGKSRGGRQIDRRRWRPSLHVVVGDDDDHGLRPDRLQCVEQLADQSVCLLVTGQGGLALGPLVMSHRVGFVDVSEDERDVAVLQDLQEMRAYGRVGRVAVGVEGHAFGNRIIGRPAKAGGPGAEQPAVVSHHRGCPQPGRGQSLEDGRRSWYTAAGPVGQIGKPPGSRPDTVPFGELTGEQRAEARVRRRGEGGHPALGRSTALLGQAPHARREIGPNGAVGEPVEPEEHDPGHRRFAHAWSGAASSLSISTGSGRSASRTRVPAGWAAASEVASWARTVTSPRSTVTRLVAPRKAVAITVPFRGPGVLSPSPASVTASGRTSATAGPLVASVCTRGRRVPLTSTAPSRTTPLSRLVRPTKEATNGVAGREYTVIGGPSCSRRPDCMTPTRSAMASASSWSWVTKRVVVPTSSCTRRISSRSRARTLASRADSGSSRSRTFGLIASARASATRCCWPPESWCAYLWA